MVLCVGKPVWALGFACYKWNIRQSLACLCTLTSWHVAFQRQSSAACSSSSMRSGREASRFRHLRSRTRPQSSSCAPYSTGQ
eukprot:6213438-Pleurochrysis_carterae.AAC.1